MKQKQYEKAGRKDESERNGIEVGGILAKGKKIAQIKRKRGRNGIWCNKQNISVCVWGGTKQEIQNKERKNIGNAFIIP